MVVMKLNKRFLQLKKIYQKNLDKFQKKLGLRTKRNQLRRMITKERLIKGIFSRFKETRAKRLEEVMKIGPASVKRQ